MAVLLVLAAIGFVGWFCWAVAYWSADTRKQRRKLAHLGATALIVYLSLCTALPACLAGYWAVGGKLA